MIIKKLIVVLSSLLISLNVFGMTRTIKQEPAIVLTAFGTTTEARATFEFIEEQVKADKSLKKIRLEWAFTSEVIRERANKAFAKKGSKTRYYSLAQVLANLEAEGYRKVIVQPLHIFPGQEYDEVTTAVKAFSMLGLRIEQGETLLHEWPLVHEVMDILEKDFLPESKGCNVIVSHGTPQTFQGANATYLGLEKYINQKYNNVSVGAVEGILTRDEALDQAKQCKMKMVRFISLMLVSGDHVINDIMAPKPEDGELSWSLEMKRAGFKTEIQNVRYKRNTLIKSLGLNKGIVNIFVHSIKEALERLEKH